MMFGVLNSRTGRWIIAIAIVLIGAICGVAVQQSTVVRAQWRILPYQSLQIDNRDAEAGATSSRLVVHEPTALDIQRGFMEHENAIRLHVVSNTRWMVQVWAEQSAVGDLPISAIQLRGDSGAFLQLSTTPQVLASGGNGVFELPIDYRIRLEGETSSVAGLGLEIVYTILSN